MTHPLSLPAVRSASMSDRGDGRSALHRLLARRVRELANGDALLERSVLLVARARDEGSVCLDLAEVAGRPWSALLGSDAEEDAGWAGADDAPEATREARRSLAPSAADWCAQLAASPAVASAPSVDAAPLVLDGERLYLLREWRAEQRLAASVAVRLRRPDRRVDAERLAPIFERLFPTSEAQAGGTRSLDRQALAAALALRRSLVLITGGPGTGKTFTVARLLALAIAEQPSLRVLLGAPTGKAAARLGESLADQVDRLPIDDPTIREAIDRRLPRTGATLHRLLGYDPRRECFARRRLRCDLLVIDEASMIDLLLMDAVFAALPPGARVVLLGDRDQLASVEAGFVFGDLATVVGLGGDAAPRGSAPHDSAPRDFPLHYSASFRELFARLAGEDAHQALEREIPPEATAALPEARTAPPDAGVALTRSWRFEARPGIGRLAAALRTGDTPTALAVLDDPVATSVSRREPSGEDDLLRPLLPALRAVVHADGPAAALEALGAIRLLSVRRGGPLGVEDTNRAVAARLGQANATWHPGRPILVEANAPEVGLWNGDLGIVWPADGRLWAYFPDPHEPAAPRRLPIAKLPRVTTAWAMTVHKSQGSEVDHVLVLLPSDTAGLATRELLYTGVTRARRRVEIVGSEASLRAALARSARRSTGLVDATLRAIQGTLESPERGLRTHGDLDDSSRRAPSPAGAP